MLCNGRICKKPAAVLIKPYYALNVILLMSLVYSWNLIKIDSYKTLKSIFLPLNYYCFDRNFIKSIWKPLNFKYVLLEFHYPNKRKPSNFHFWSLSATSSSLICWNRVFHCIRTSIHQWSKWSFRNRLQYSNLPSPANK